MKKTFLLLLIVTFAATVNSQTSDRKWAIGGGAGAYGTLKNGGIGVMPEFYFGRFLSPKFDLIFKANLGVLKSDLISNVFKTHATNDIDLANLLLNIRYKLTDESKNFRPYLFAGPGLLKDNHGEVINFDAGLGFKYYFSPRLAAYFQAGYVNGIQTIRNSKRINENLWKNTAGLEFNFGKAKDSDMDGVSDNKDKCPNTPVGVAVDEKGCPVDTDGDGVADYLDDCPTVAGLTSLKGCPDTDKDGVADKDDACPDVAGPVSLKGCPDKDGDGIADKDDKCPDTPKGWKVDASGCPVDTDNDGVADSVDDCPTVAGTKDNKGCPPNETEKPKVINSDQMERQSIKISNLHFATGKSELTNASKLIVNKLVKILDQNKGFLFNIFGHADSQGPEDMNLKLSESRIESTLKYLESKGIPNNRIYKQEAFGETKPAASNETPEGRLLNRRVEFEIYKMK